MKQLSDNTVIILVSIAIILTLTVSFIDFNKVNNLITGASSAAEVGYVRPDVFVCCVNACARFYNPVGVGPFIHLQIAFFSRSFQLFRSRLVRPKG